MINDLLILTVLLMMVLIPVSFLLGIYFIVSGKNKKQEDLELANRRISKGYKFLLFLLLCLLIGFGSCINVRLF